MLANLDLILQVRPNALLVNESALIPNGTKTFVFIVDKDKKAQMKEVHVGTRQAGVVEILDGVTLQDTVIIEGHQKIGPGSPVNPKPPTSPGAPTGGATSTY